ncbi:MULTISPECIES: DUF924 family protein [unclassified Wenzhouxiangella]|uniref:DUF924 family protein n=1 Tax=unclassified Wenzhouxiangella TaxID=2613841 RepID=UPI000E3296F9|nr:MULTISPECIES: DUF924 family protein [unclassified Wenzhouxiangella]RFF26575.1 DUF924 domain-containing protein [Wenzhouxiangella sp. 15181]RFP70190.1 DUF924 domain-containing protein [Wenzhouxiangella sp. 15190]
MSEAATPEDLLAFWFGEARDRPEAIGDRMAFWFKPSTADDAAVREQFETTMRQAAADLLTDWLPTPQGRLALILALDQAPRVIFRRKPRAFAYDGRALALTLAGITGGIDREYGLAERAFFYIPLQHSEDSLVQEQSVRLYEQLVSDFPEHADMAGGFLKHAREHAAIIERFGRYPHRNEVLGRKSTEAELNFLENGPRYGQ